MRRLLFVLIMLATLSMGTLSASAATGTPEAANTAPTGPEVGDAVSLYNVDAEEIGTVTVNEVIDPFENYDASYGPQRGFRFVAANITVAATATDPVTADSYAFSLVDTDGFASSPSWSTPKDNSQGEVFAGGEITPGSEMTGLILFEVYKGVDIATIEFAPSYDQVITVADMRDEGTAAGTAVPLLDADANPVAEMTVLGVIDPFEDFGTGGGPERGYRCVSAVISITNVSDQPYTVESYGFQLVDTEGYVGQWACYYRTDASLAQVADLSSITDIAPGDTVTGLVTVQLFKGSNIDLVLFSSYTFQQQQRIRLAEYGDQAPEPFDMSTLPPVSVSSGDSGSTDSGSTDSGSTDTSSCDPAVKAWMDEVSPILDAIPDDANIDPTDPTSVSDADIATLRSDADAVRAAADEIEALDTPEAAQTASEEIVSFLRDGADFYDAYADAIESGDADAISETAAEFLAMTEEALTGDFFTLAATCMG